MDLTVTEAIKLQVDGLDDVDITCGEPGTFDPTHIEPGRFQIAITGSHKKVPTVSEPRPAANDLEQPTGVGKNPEVVIELQDSALTAAIDGAIGSETREA